MRAIARRCRFYHGGMESPLSGAASQRTVDRLGQKRGETRLVAVFGVRAPGAGGCCGVPLGGMGKVITNALYQCSLIGEGRDLASVFGIIAERNGGLGQEEAARHGDFECPRLDLSAAHKPSALQLQSGIGEVE